jgi:organic hydroperoxide reductase OsmC/OhrA
VAEASGEVEAVDGVLIVKRIRVGYTLKVSTEKRETAERVHGFHVSKCPVAQTIGGCVDISTALRMEEP